MRSELNQMASAPQALRSQNWKALCSHYITLTLPYIYVTFSLDDIVFHSVKNKSKQEEFLESWAYEASRPRLHLYSSRSAGK